MAALLLPLLFSGCAVQQQGSWSEERELVMKSLEDAHLKEAKLEKRVQDLDQRVLLLQKAVIQQQAQVEALTAGQIARKQSPRSRTTAYKGSSISADSADLTRRLDQIAKNMDTGAATEKSSTPENSDERDTYTAAYLAYKSSKYDESIQTFRTLLAQYPNGEYSDQAYFWLGEGLLAKHKPKEAAEVFDTVVMEYPKSSKHAAALLRLATCYQQLDRHGDARAALQRLIREHPGTPEAKLAANRLKK